jgi:hypothetical protein
LIGVISDIIDIDTYYDNYHLINIAWMEMHRRNDSHSINSDPASHMCTTNEQHMHNSLAIGLNTKEVNSNETRAVYSNAAGSSFTTFMQISLQLDL